MNERRRERAFAGALVAVLLVGVSLDLAVGEVEPGGEEAAERSTFHARSIFCPGSVPPGGADLDFLVTAPWDEGLTVGIEPHGDEPVRVAPSGGLFYDVSGGGPSDVVGYGGPASVSVAATTERPGTGAAAAACASAAGVTWYFASGSASIHVDERILLYNPFPDEAVVRIHLFTPKGEEARASLADIAVPALDFAAVKLNKKVGVRKTLAVQVRAERGRVVAWRQMFVDGKEGPGGVELSLGAPEPAAVWHFPEGAAGGGAREHISILNPSEKEAVVALTLAVGRAKVLSPPDLMELAIPPRSQVNVPVGDHVKAGDEPVAVGVTVRSVNDVPVVAEREVSYDSDEGRGVAAEVGASVSSERWMAPPPVRKAAEDALSILNPSTEEALVKLRLVDLDGHHVATPGLGAVAIGPGGRARVPVARWTDGVPVLAFVDSDVPVVVERFAATASDVASLMGVPLR